MLADRVFVLADAQTKLNLMGGGLCMKGFFSTIEGRWVTVVMFNSHPNVKVVLPTRALFKEKDTTFVNPVSYLYLASFPKK